jgi:hypothetical protein
MTAKSVDLCAVSDAKRLVNELLKLESRGSGDLESAMRRLANRYGLSWRTFWTLRYRNPKHVFVGVYETLKAAHRAEVGRQITRLRHDLLLAQESGVPVDDIADQVSTLAAELEACMANRAERDA